MNTLTIDTITIRKDSEGRYCLNDLHKVAGGAEKDEPNRHARTDEFSNLIAAIRNEYESNPAKNGGKERISPCMTSGGRNGGTFVVKEMVYA